MFRSLILASAFIASLGLAQDCILAVPPNPLTAQGLATPYIVSGDGCSQRGDAPSFVECAIYDNAGNLQLYAPLVVDQGDKPGADFVPPVVPTVANGATVACWFGTNGASLTLSGAIGGCTNGVDGAIFGQFATCGGEKFFTKTLADVQAGILVPPPLGTPSQGGGNCPTTRDFRIVDQDQSDNVVSRFLIVNGHVLAQNTQAESAKAKNSTLVSNGSDNGLVDRILDPILGCTPWMVPSITDPSGMTSGLAPNELQASVFQQAPVALIPVNDPMVLTNAAADLKKTNAYRAAVGQTPAATMNDASASAYCFNILASGIWIAQNQKLFLTGTSPMPDVANNLFTFMAQRFAAAIGPDNLNCLPTYGITNNPVTLTLDGNCIVIAAVINVQVLQMLQTKSNGTTVSSSSSSSTRTTATSKASSSSTLATASSKVSSSSTLAAVSSKVSSSSTLAAVSSKVSSSSTLAAASSKVSSSSTLATASSKVSSSTKTVASSASGASSSQTVKAVSSAASSSASATFSSQPMKGATSGSASSSSTAQAIATSMGAVSSSTGTKASVSSTKTTLATVTKPTSVVAPVVSSSTGTVAAVVSSSAGSVCPVCPVATLSATPPVATAPAGTAPTTCPTSNLQVLQNGWILNTQTNVIYFPVPQIFAQLFGGLVGNGGQ